VSAQGARQGDGTDDGYAIRPATPADLPFLPAIERAAAARFRGTAFAALADAPLAAASARG